MSADDLRNRIEELLKFTLHSFLNETLQFDLHMSKDFCSHLLKHDPSPDFFNFSAQSDDSLKGVPLYPLYKRLAFALQHTIMSGTFYRTYNQMPMLGVECSLSHKEQAWGLLISRKGSDLIDVLKTVDFELHVREPFFSQLADGVKRIEGRCAAGKCSSIGSGNLILFNECLLFKVQDVRWYASFSDMLEAESLAEVLPGVKSIKEGVQIYRKFYSEEEEYSSGVLAICISRVALQPYFYLASILSELSYSGIRGILGLTNTKGTTEHALPPPRSALLSSFTMPYNKNVKGSTLTHGARALAKHAHRSNNKFWGILDGSDSNKNKLALDVIVNLVEECCWLNLHVVPPHGDVFEIRISHGYGARWSKDGSKFIGFLEPYVEDGHSTGWKH
ncbi:hypothetical protein CsatB_026647 [Cannabis sativa]